jgi:hypothetical protein
MEALPVGRLPATFNHAIEITRKLGLDYLRIDSLCIIQNNEANWQKESALMSSVYGGSAISIAASSARDSTHGCFLKLPHFSGGLRARITDGGRKRVQDFRSKEVYNLSTFDAHLGTRAWHYKRKFCRHGQFILAIEVLSGNAERISRLNTCQMDFQVC